MILNKAFLQLLMGLILLSGVCAESPEVNVQNEIYTISGDFIKQPGVTLEWVERLRIYSKTEFDYYLSAYSGENREEARFSLFQGKKVFLFGILR